MAKAKEDKKAKGVGSARTETVRSGGHQYDASSITVLEGLEPVRKRPGMYIGTTGPDGLHHLITEIFDNSRDEAMGGFCDNIEVVLLPGNRIRVTDNGRGVPVDIHKQSKVSALETIMTTLHAGGKFGGEGYKVSGGLHGVGASVVNALSIFCEVVVHRDGGVYIQEYKQGKAKARVKKIGSSKLHGTIVTFEADPAIFPQIEYDANRVMGHMREQAYLVRGLRISVIDARAVADKIDLADVFYFKDLGIETPSQTFYFEGGLMSLVEFTNKLQKPVHKNIFYVEKKVEGVESVEIALQYVDDISSKVLPFANNIFTPEGGTHLTGFKTALTRTLNTYARANNAVKDSEDNFTGDDCLEGLTAVISVKLREIQFEGQTKAKLGSVEAQTAVATVFGEAFAMFLEEKPDDARAIISKAILALKARKAAKAAKDSILRKGALEGMTLPGKLADCQSKDASESEIFIVEGDSAGGCFSGDTKVALVDGRNLSFEELVREEKIGKKNYCYTMSADQQIAVGEILHPRITHKNASVIKITLDNGEEIICTPDHKFMLRDGQYKEAHLLTAQDSLFPLYKKISKIEGRITIAGYEMLWDQTRKYWIFTHLLSDDFNLSRGIYAKGETDSVRHHIDYNKRNNDPSNIKRLAKIEHLLLHTRNLDKTLHSAQSKAKSVAIRKTKQYREKISQWANRPEVKKMLSERAKKQWTNEAYKKFMTERFKEFYNSNQTYRKENNAHLDKEQKKYWNDKKHRGIQAERVKKFFETNPERKLLLSTLSKTQWKDQDLIEWRRNETSKQWTPEFRAKRKEAYDKTYYQRTLATLREVWDKEGTIEAFDTIRIAKKDHTLLSLKEFRRRFFHDDREAVVETVKHFNHKITKIEVLKKRIPVYDIEVPSTHNFALASGIFVHNSSKQGRDRKTQAILPLRGKILNIERARLDKMLASEQIKNLVVALGTAIGDTFDISKLRYHKVIIATDADTDGGHIRTLILTLFYRYFKPLIEGGFIYIAQPPLYKIKKGKEIMYYYSEDEKNGYLKKEGVKAEELEISDEPEQGDVVEVEGDEEESNAKATKKVPKLSIQRYKGLGEMNPEELWETTMDPARRILKQVNIEDGQEADKVFDMLMGTDVFARKSFIQSNAKMATLDI